MAPTKNEDKKYFTLNIVISNTFDMTSTTLTFKIDVSPPKKNTNLDTIQD